jgi:hypothetical protein
MKKASMQFKDNKRSVGARAETYCPRVLNRTMNNRNRSYLHVEGK